jgi:pimeloyl-ACP methyl ester carboxylesterase
MSRLLYGPGTPRAVIRADKRIIESTAGGPEGRLAQGMAVAGYQSRDRLALLAVPTLVVHGDADRIVSHEMGAELAALIPGAEFVTLPKMGHVYMTAADGEANRVVLEFLRRRGRRTSSASAIG